MKAKLVYEKIIVTYRSVGPKKHYNKNRVDTITGH